MSDFFIFAADFTVKVPHHVDGGCDVPDASV